MLNEYREYAEYTQKPTLESMSFRMKRAHLADGLSGVARAMTIVARYWLFEDGLFEDNNEKWKVKEILKLWCGFSDELPETLTKEGEKQAKEIAGWFPKYVLLLLRHDLVEAKHRSEKTIEKQNELLQIINQDYSDLPISKVVSVLNDEKKKRTSNKAVKKRLLSLLEQEGIDSISQAKHSVQNKITECKKDINMFEKLIRSVALDTIMGIGSVEDALNQLKMVLKVFDENFPLERDHCSRRLVVSFLSIIEELKKKEKQWDRKIFNKGVYNYELQNEDNDFKAVTFSFIIADALNMGKLRNMTLSAKKEIKADIFKETEQKLKPIAKGEADIIEHLVAAYLINMLNDSSNTSLYFGGEEETSFVTLVKKDISNWWQGTSSAKKIIPSFLKDFYYLPNCNCPDEKEQLFESKSIHNVAKIKVNQNYLNDLKIRLDSSGNDVFEDCYRYNDEGSGRYLICEKI